MSTLTHEMTTEANSEADPDGLLIRIRLKRKEAMAFQEEMQARNLKPGTLGRLVFEERYLLPGGAGKSHTLASKLLDKSPAEERENKEVRRLR